MVAETKYSHNQNVRDTIDRSLPLHSGFGLLLPNQNNRLRCLSSRVSEKPSRPFSCAHSAVWMS
jgi:hypothetical protein